MSQWTHVNACIRFDGIRGMTPIPDLGHTHHYDDPPESLNACDVPCGSEGSLQHKMVEMPGDGAIRFVAAIWGDLRDYSDIAEIEAYLTRIVAGQLVRSGIAEIIVERGKTQILRYNQEEKAWATILEEDEDNA